MAGRWSTSCRVISQEMPPCPITMAARSTVTGTSPAGQQLLDLATGAQVVGQVLVVPAQSTQIDDPLEPGLLGGGAERRGRPSASLRTKSSSSSECTR